MKNFTLLLLCFLLTNVICAQKTGVYDTWVKTNQEHQIKASDLGVKTVNKFDVSNQKSNENNAIRFKIQLDKLSELTKSRSRVIQINLPGLNNQKLKLDLYRVDVMKKGAAIVLDDNGQKSNLIYSFDNVAHFRGIANGDNHSLVSLSILDNEIMGIISSPELGELNIGRIKGSKDGEHVLYDALKMEQGEVFSCGTLDDGNGYTKDQLKEKFTKATGDPIDIFIEVDGDLTSALGGATATTNWITGLFNQSATLYANENITIRISEIEINTSVEYRGKSSSSLLSKFQGAKASSFNGDLGHMVNNEPSAGGIAAGFSGLCNSDRSQSMCFSGLQTSYNSIPTYSWSVMVFTHEMGHLIGSRHTHACVWNGNNTAIDGCAGGTEGGCPLPGYPPNGGTIMSYCHQQSVGINFSQGFGPQPGAVIRNSVTAAGCLGGGAQATCSDGIQNQGETGIDCGGPCAACPPGGSCGNPTGLTVTNMQNQGGKRANLNWNSVSGALSYDVQIRVAGSGSWTTNNTSSTTISFSGFTSGTSYEWQVRANCTGASGAFVSCTFTWQNGGSSNCGSNTGGLVFDNLDEEYIIAFPNPSQGTFSIFIENAKNEPYEINVYDLLGKKLKTLTYQKNQSGVVLELAEQKVGFYLINVKGNNRRMNRKILITN